MKLENCYKCNKPRWTRDNSVPCKNCRRKNGEIRKREPRIRRIKQAKPAPPPKAEKKGKKGKEKK